MIRLSEKTMAKIRNEKPAHCRICRRPLGNSWCVNVEPRVMEDDIDYRKATVNYACETCTGHMQTALDFCQLRRTDAMDSNPNPDRTD